MLDKEWFINEITRIEVKSLTDKGSLRAIVTIFYGILGLRGFRVYRKEKDGNLVTWVKAPCFNQQKYSEVPRLDKEYKPLWFKWMERIRDKYLEWKSQHEEEISDKEIDKITKEIDANNNSNSY